jgi:hypothetical protein
MQRKSDKIILTILFILNSLLADIMNLFDQYTSQFFNLKKMQF